MPEEQRKNKLEQDSIGKLMSELCLQTTFSIMLYNFYMITDTFYVASGVGSIASGAIGIFSPFLLFVNGISATLGTGGGSVISRRLGEKNTEAGRRVVGCMIWIWIMCAGVITLTGLIWLEPLLNILGCTPEIYPYALDYGRIMLISTMASTGFSGIMRAEGDSFYSTLQWSCPVLINFLLDPLFIYGFELGISGAALATLIAQLFSMISSVHYFFLRSKTPCRISIQDIRWDTCACKEILYAGLPAFLNSLGGSFAGTVGNQIFGSVGGTQAISTYAIISRIQSFIATPFFGMVQGIQPMLGFDWGRRNIARIKKTMRYAIKAEFIYGSIVAIIVFAGAEVIMNIFTSDEEILVMGKNALRIICWSLAVGGIMPLTQTLFLAFGNGKKVLSLSLTSIFLIRLPLLFLAGLMKQMQGMWWMLLLTEWLIAGAGYYHLRKEKRRERVIWKV